MKEFTRRFEWVTLTTLKCSGGHVAAAAAKRTTALIQAVVGLCPAGPLFSLDDPANRIHHTDAQYVESILTDAGRLGFQHPVSQANYYINWGKQFQSPIIRHN